MAAKAFLVLCASALLVKTISACPCSGTAVNSLGLAGFGGLGLAGTGLGIASCGLAVPSTNGGGFPITSLSPIAPLGLSVLSENCMEGSLAVAGQLPFLSAVALEGQLPTAGACGVQYSCGDGSVGIVSEGLGAGLASPLGYGAGLGLANAGLLNTGLVGSGLVGIGGCGCGGLLY